MRAKLVAIAFFYLFLQFPLLAQEPIEEVSHYVFFYSYKDAKDYKEYYPEVVVSKIYKDTARTHFLFKLLNLKKRALEAMKSSITGHEAFLKHHTQYGSTKKEAEAKLKKLMDVWKRNETQIHYLDVNYENATGKEF